MKLVLNSVQLIRLLPKSGISADIYNVCIVMEYQVTSVLPFAVSKKLLKNYANNITQFHKATILIHPEVQNSFNKSYINRAPWSCIKMILLKVH